MMDLTRDISTFGDLTRDISTFGDLTRDISTFGDLTRDISTFGDLTRDISTFGDLTRDISTFGDLTRDISVFNDLARNRVTQVVNVNAPSAPAASSVNVNASPVINVSNPTPVYPVYPYPMAYPVYSGPSITNIDIELMNMLDVNALIAAAKKEPVKGVAVDLRKLQNLLAGSWNNNTLKGDGCIGPNCNRIGLNNLTRDISTFGDLTRDISTFDLTRDITTMGDLTRDISTFVL